MHINIKAGLSIKAACFLFLATMKVAANTADTRPYELERANKNLNSIYQKILGNLQSSDQIKLKKAQREWIIFRDSDCLWAFSAEPQDCLIDRTESRVKELESTLFFDKKGNYSSIK